MSLGNPARTTALSREWSPADIEIVIAPSSGESLIEYDIEFMSMDVDGRFIRFTGFDIYNEHAVTIGIDRATLLNALLDHPDLVQILKNGERLAGS